MKKKLWRVYVLGSEEVMTDEEIAEATTAALEDKQVYYVDLACLEVTASSRWEAITEAEKLIRKGEFEICNVELKEDV